MASKLFARNYGNVMHFLGAYAPKATHRKMHRRQTIKKCTPGWPQTPSGITIRTLARIGQRPLSPALVHYMETQQWGALANDTKWDELQQLMSGLEQRAPYWRTQATNGFVYPPKGWDGDWTYHFRLGEHKYIEWCEMSPRSSESALSLAEVAKVCRHIGFEIEVLESTVKVIGYRRL